MGLIEGASASIGKFMAGCNSYRDASVVLVGAPMDFTCSFRAGAKFGPRKIREVSDSIEEFSIYMNKSLNDVRFFDSGDLELQGGNIEKSLGTIEESTGKILSDNKIPFFIGGDHSISVPVIKKCYEKYGNDLIIIQFDAHADLRDGYLCCKYSHASAIRRIMDFMPGRNIYQFGIRSGAREEFEFAAKNTNMFKYEVYEPLKRLIPEIKERPVYITLDIDVADPAYANGTGTPEPGGIDSRELLNSLKLFEQLNVIGFDLVEVSPPYDTSDRTAVLAAKIIREMVLICA